MKKTIIIIALIIVTSMSLLTLTGCSNEKENTGETSSSSIFNKKKEFTAEEIANQLKEKISDMGKIEVYDEENDPNNLLGRPNQYTSKINFADNRIEQYEGSITGGSIEVFKNSTDMENRKSYVESISAQASMFAQYIYSEGNYLLRIDKDLTPSQAKEYEEAFYEIVK